MNNVSVSFSRVKQAKKNVGVGDACMYAEDSMTGDWITGKVTGKQLGCCSPEKGCYCSQFGEMREVARCHLVVIVNLAIRMWGLGGGVLACYVKQNFRANLIF